MTPEMANLRTKNITYDDRDTKNLKYGPHWFLTGTWNASSVGLTGTLSSSDNVSANVTFEFPEPAIAFHYFGMRRSGGGLYEICIDCDPGNPSFETIDALNATDDGKNPPVALFSKRFDIPAQHVVILRNRNDTRLVPSGVSQITIDRFVLEVVDNSMAPVTPPPSPSPMSDSGGAGLPVGAIVGGALGGILFVVIVIVTGLCCWHRKQPRAVDDPDPPTRHHYPYPSIIYGRSRSDTNTSFTLSTLSPSIFSSGPSMYFGSGTGSSSRTRSSRTRSTQSSSDRRSRRGRRYEVDAGPVIVEGEDEGDEALLPQYVSAPRGNSTRCTSSTPGALESIPEHEGAQQPSRSSGSLPPSLVPSRLKT
ncbi:hypothetical protein PQX77_010976 [Marasmius sp. AFHP31]|nr:hypothetical protein PQX77_010976 [Marasmius sp. AFHP31]